jgi:hypothetical protein
VTTEAERAEKQRKFKEDRSTIDFQLNAHKYFHPEFNRTIQRKTDGQNLVMPAQEERKRGGVIRYRTVSLPGGEYIHVAVVRKKGPRGGRTIAGPVRKKRGQDFFEFKNRDAPDKLLNTGVGQSKPKTKKRESGNLYGIKGSGRI